MNVFRRGEGHAIAPKIFRSRPCGGQNRRRDATGSRPPEIGPKSPSPPSPRRGAARAAGRITAAALATLAVLWGCVAAYRAATTADYFAVSEIRVTGTSRLTEAEVVEAAAIARGTNAFRIDVEAVSQRLEQHPWIAEATAVRRLPRGLEIGIVERKAEAIALFDVPYLVDDSGAVFKRWAPGDPTPAPVISGLSREQLATDEETVQSAINDAIALARRYRAQGLERIAPVAEVHAEVGGGFSLTVGDHPFYVRFGAGPYRQKLTRLADLLRRLRADGERPAVIYFDNEVRPDRVTVKVKKRPPDPAVGDTAVTRTP